MGLNVLVEVHFFKKSRYIKKLNLPIEKIKHIEGNDKDLHSELNKAYALIYPSKYEGFGLPILEAMSLGCPVISSNASSLPEVYGMLHSILTQMMCPN